MTEQCVYGNENLGLKKEPYQNIKTQICVKIHIK